MALDNEFKSSTNERELAEQIFRKLVYDLSDIAVKWGSISLRDENIVIFRSSDFEAEYPFVVTSDARPTRQFLSVVKGNSIRSFHLISSSEEEIRVPLPAYEKIEESPSGIQYVIRKDEGIFIWDKLLNPLKVIQSISKIDKTALDRKLINSEDQKRKSIPSGERNYVAEEKYKVGEVFSHEGTFYPILGDQNPNEVLNEFDNPEELKLRRDPYGMGVKGFISKKDSAYFERRDIILNDILIEKGMTAQDLEMLISLNESYAIKFILAIREEIERRMQKDR